MALRPPRTMTILVAGGLLSGSLLLGTGSALAAPTAPTPAVAPAVETLPSSFVPSAAGPAPGRPVSDPNTLLGSAFPGLPAGAPAYLGYDPASAVTTAGQIQALPVDGLADGGVGVPAVIAVLALSGVAAFTVRRFVVGRAGSPPDPSEAPDAPSVSDVTDAAGPSAGRTPVAA